MATELAKAYVQIVPSAQGLTGSLTSLMSGEGTAAGEAAGKNAGTSFGQMMKKTLVGLGIGKLLMDSIGNTSEFETGMAKVNTLFSGTKEQFAGLQDEVLKLSSAYGISAVTLAEAAYSAESAGVATENLGEMMDNAAKLATAGFTDVDTALSATAKTMNAYGIEGKKAMDKVSKVLIQTQNLGITTVGELGASLANVTPTAAAMGVSFEQVGAAMSQLTAAGVPTAQATTQLRAAMTELGKAGTKADKAFREAAKNTEYAGLSFREAMEAGADLGDVFGLMQEYADGAGLSMVDLWGSVEAGNAAMLIASDVETFNSNLAAMATDADVVGEAYDKMANTFGNSMNKLKESAKNFMTTLFSGGDIGASFDNMLSSVADVGQKLIGWLKTGLTTLAEHLPEMMGSLLDFGAGILSALGEINWIELGTTIINGLIGAIGTLGVKLVEWFSDIIKSLASGDVDFASIGTAIWDGITSVLTTTGEWFTKLFDTAVDAVGSIDFSGIGTSILDGIKTILDEGGKFISDLFGIGRDAAADDSMGYDSIGTAILNGIKTILDTAGNFLGNLFQNGLEAAEERPWPSVGEAIKTGVNLVLNGGKFLSEIFSAGADLIKAIDWKNVGKHAEELIVAGLDGAKTLVNTFSNAANRLLSSIGWESIGESITNLLNAGLNGAAQLVNTVSDAADRLISSIGWESIGGGITDLLNAGLGGATLLVNTVSSAANSLLTSINWTDIGTSASTMLSNGLSGAANLLESGFRGAVNFLDGVDWGALGSKISSALGDVFGGLGDFLGGVLSGAGDAAAGAGAGIGAIFEAGGQWLASLINGTDQQKVVEELKNTMAAMKRELEAGKKQVEEAAKSVGAGIVISLKEDLKPETMANIGKAIITGVGGGIVLAVPSLAEKVSSAKTAIKDSLEGKGETIWSDVGKTIVGDVSTGIGDNESTLTSKATEIAGSFAETFTDEAASALESGKSSISEKAAGIGESAASSIADGVSSGMAGAKKTIATTIAGAIGYTPTSSDKADWISIGQNIILGIVSGINSYEQYLINRINKLCETITNLLKNNLHISSPSRVMRDAVGKWIPAGIAEGIDEYSYLVEDAINNMTGDMTSNRLRSSLMAQNGNLLSGRFGGNTASSIGDGFGEAQETQVALLREQNTLLRRILEKDTSIRIGASVGLGRTVKQSLDMYSLVGG